MTTASDRVLRKAARMFAEKGVHAISMRDLALELNIQAPSLYSHFPSKEALIEGVCAEYLRRVQSLLEHRVAGGLPQLLDAWRGILDAQIDGVRIVHGDPGVRDLSCGRLGRIQDLALSVQLESHGVPTVVCAPLIAAFRQPYMQPGEYVDLRAITAAGRLILATAEQHAAVA